MKMMRFATPALLVAIFAITQNAWAGDKDRKSGDTDKAGEKDRKQPGKKADTKEIIINAELTNADLKDKVRANSFAKTYTYRMVANGRYQIDMISGVFDSYLRLEDPTGNQVASDDDGGGFPNARMIYIAPKAGDYTIVCTSFGAGSVGNFRLEVRDITGKDPVNPNIDKKFPPKLDGPGFDKKEFPGKNVKAKEFDLKADKDGKAEYAGKLAAEDGVYVDNRFGKREKRSKLFNINMEANKSYRIDLASSDFDAFLFLLDDTGKVIALNDDNGESLDSRIVQKIERAGKYTIVATSLSGASSGNFKLNVRLASEDEVKEVNLRNKVNQMFGLNVDRKAIAQEVTKHLEGKGAKVSRSDLGMAMAVAQALEFSKDNKTAADTLKQFAKIFANANDPIVASQSKSMAGMARRMDLVGNTMEIKGKLIDGKEFDLKDLKGKVVLVDFWATWCGPCVQEIPHVKDLYQKYNKRGFEVVGISLDNTEDAVRKFNEKEKLPWGSIFNDSQKRGESLADYYGVISIPLAILVDREGRVVSLNARGPELTRLLEKMLDEKK